MTMSEENVSSIDTKNTFMVILSTGGYVYIQTAKMKTESPATLEDTIKRKRERLTPKSTDRKLLFREKRARL